MSTGLNAGGYQQIAVGVVPATYDKAGFDALTWVTLEQADNLGTIGGETTITTFIPVKNPTVNKYAGSTDYGTQDLTFAEDDEDLGQVAFEAAFRSKAKSSFRIVSPDGLTTRAYTGVVSSFTASLGAADDVVMGGSTVAINNEIIKYTL